MGDRGIMLMGGTLSLHGNGKLLDQAGKNSRRGQQHNRSLESGDWKKGEQIVVASTDFDPHQAEGRTIAGISGKVITLDQKLAVYALRTSHLRRG